MTGLSNVFPDPPGIARIAPSSPVPAFRVARRKPALWPDRLAAAGATLVCLLAPLPHGSNTPAAWLLWSCILGAVGLACGFSRRTACLRRDQRMLLALGLGLAGFALFQAAPLPGWRGGIPFDLPGGQITLTHLSLAPGASFLAALRLTGYVLFFALMSRAARHRRRAKTIGWVLFAAAVGQALLAIAMLRLLGDIDPFGQKSAYLGSATGTYVNRNSLAAFLGMGLVLGLALLFNDPGRSARRAAGARLARLAGVLGLLAILGALILTRSRMGNAASLMAAVFTIRLCRTRAGRKRALILAGAAVLALLAQTGLAERFAGTGAPELRGALYRQVLSMIRDRPLTGFGLDTFALAFQPYHGPPVAAEFVWKHAHSSYLHLWAEAGVVFGSLPIVAGAIAARGLWRRARRAAPGQSMAIAALGALVLAGVHSSVDFVLEIPANAYFLLALIALGLGTRQHQKGDAT